MISRSDAFCKTSTVRNNDQTRLFHQLEHFIAHEMRMSHVYQPMMLREILRSNGAATVNEGETRWM
jgi:hypothetical protein